jgi:protease-4
MKQFLLTIAGVFVGLMLFMVIVPMIFIFGLVGLAQKSAEGPVTPAAAVLELDLRTGLSDQDPQNPFAVFGHRGHRKAEGGREGRQGQGRLRAPARGRHGPGRGR